MSNKKCVFCKTTSLDRELGPFYKISVHNLHSNCLVFSSDIRQNPDKTKGINGFEKKTIDYTLNRGKTRICSLCSKKGATVLCSGNEESSCKASFHLTCALASKKTLHEYYDGFKSYCYKHILLECLFDCEPITGICVKLDCCKNPLNIHNECIENFVRSSKAQSKCPTCMNKHVFIKFLEDNFSLKIQTDQNASFAIQTGGEYAFDLKCLARICKCTRDGGRERHEEAFNSTFELLECSRCGANGMHRTCGNIEINDEWICPDCNLESDDLPEDEERVETLIDVAHSSSSRPGVFPKRIVGSKESHSSKKNKKGFSKTDSPGPTLTPPMTRNRTCRKR